jgi:putative nucleotidyltransferase with HDIG domain
MGSAENLGRYKILDTLLEGCQVLAFDWRYLYLNDAVVAQSRLTREGLLGHVITDVYPGVEKTEMFAELARCMVNRTTGRLENEFRYADGSTAWFELRIEPVPEGVFVLSLDITGRKLAERSMKQQLQRLRSLRAIDVAILGTTDFRVALRTVLEETARCLGVDAALVFLPGSGGTVLRAAADIGFQGDAAGRVTVRFGEGAVGQAAFSHRPALVQDAAADGIAREIPSAILAEGMRGFCAVPLVAKGDLVGVLAIACHSPLDASDDWLSFLESLAGQAAMAIDAGQSHEHLQRAHRDLQRAYDSTIEGWAGALELRDRETAHHTQRVTELTLDLARAAGIDDAELVHIRRGALLHDIGKMAIPDAILLKQDKLTEEESRVMHEHPAYAYQLLWPIAYLHPALDIPYCHHERWDGTGYPRGLKGEAIPFAARLFAVVDVWDAVRSQRPYREGWSDERSRQHLRSLAGTHLDPSAVELFFRVMDDRAREDGRQRTDSQAKDGPQAV